MQRYTSSRGFLNPIRTSSWVSMNRIRPERRKWLQSRCHLHGMNISLCKWSILLLLSHYYYIGQLTVYWFVWIHSFVISGKSICVIFYLLLCAGESAVVVMVSDKIIAVNWLRDVSIIFSTVRMTFGHGPWSIARWQVRYRIERVQECEGQWTYRTCMLLCILYMVCK